VGQASIGMNAGSGRNLCAGFWCSGISAFVSVENPDAPAELAFRPSEESTEVIRTRPKC